MSGIFMGLLALMVLIAFWTDIRKGRIPNWLTLSGTLLGAALHGALERLSGLYFSLAGLIVLFLVLLLFYGIGALGAGDVKWFAAIGAIMGIVYSLQLLLLSIVYAGFFGLLFMIWRKRLWNWGKSLMLGTVAAVSLRSPRIFYEAFVFKGSEPIRFPFMLAVLPAALSEFIAFYWRGTG